MSWGLYYATVPRDAGTLEALTEGLKSSYRELADDDVEQAKRDASRIMVRVVRGLDRHGRRLEKVCIFPTTRRALDRDGRCYLWAPNGSWRRARRTRRSSRSI